MWARLKKQVDLGAKIIEDVQVAIDSCRMEREVFDAKPELDDDLKPELLSMYFHSTNLWGLTEYLSEKLADLRTKVASGEVEVSKGLGLAISLKGRELERVSFLNDPDEKERHLEFHDAWSRVDRFVEVAEDFLVLARAS